VGPEGAGEETGGEEQEPENVTFEPASAPSAEVEPASFEQPELPWHMPIAESERVVAEAPVAEVEVEPVAEAASVAADEPVAKTAPEAPEPPEAPAESLPAVEPPAAEPEPEVPAPAPAPEEPPRPRRSGWWQRARATIVGQ
jgi:ribonuclease E